MKPRSKIQIRLPIWLIKVDPSNGVHPQTFHYYSRGERFWIEDWLDFVKVRFNGVDVIMPDIPSTLEMIIEGLDLRDKLRGDYHKLR